MQRGDDDAGFTGRENAAEVQQIVPAILQHVEGNCIREIANGRKQFPLTNPLWPSKSGERRQMQTRPASDLQERQPVIQQEVYQQASTGTGLRRCVT